MGGDEYYVFNVHGKAARGNTLIIFPLQELKYVAGPRIGHVRFT